jgi:DNA-binding transcriptional ArsR family regulator
MAKRVMADEQARVLLFKILANNVRLRLIEALSADARSVGELCEETGEEQTRVSHELRCLTVCGLVTQKREGKRIIYSLNRKTVLPILRAADTHAAKFAEGLKGCDMISEARSIQLPKVTVGKHS